MSTVKSVFPVYYGLSLRSCAITKSRLSSHPNTPATFERPAVSAQFALGLPPLLVSKTGYQTMSLLTIERKQVGDQVVLLVLPTPDAENTPEFEEKYTACIAEGLTSVVVDVGGLAYVSSMGLRSFVSLGKDLQSKGGALRICRLNGLVKQLFQITGLIQIFQVYETVESALIRG